jgi:hypothetical protein
MKNLKLCNLLLLITLLSVFAFGQSSSFRKNSFEKEKLPIEISFEDEERFPAPVFFSQPGGEVTHLNRPYGRIQKPSDFFETQKYWFQKRFCI